MADPSGGARSWWSGWFRGLFGLRPAPLAWGDAARAGTCAGGVILVGWLLGDVPAGIAASIGAFTALFGAGLPYTYRARLLAVIAAAFALAVTAGHAAAASPWVSVVAVAVIAVVATWLCRAWDVGPPGAYMFVLACATATSLPMSGGPWRLGLLVLAGGATSCLLHMAGALVAPRGPERTAVAGGAAAVQGLLEAVGTDRYPAARDEATRAMHRCWVVLVSLQPRAGRSDGTLPRLRALAVRLHALLAEGMRAHHGGTAVPTGSVERARELARQVDAPPPVGSPPGPHDLPRGRPAPWQAARELLLPGSRWRIVLLRVGVAAVVAGIVGVYLGLDHRYWAVAAAVLVLAQGLSWARTLERTVQRVLGTWVGLLLTAAVLVGRPAGIWLAVTVAVLQAIVQLCVARNYGLAVVFITPLALTIGSAGAPADLGVLLWARNVDTVVGCALGVAMFLVIAPGRGAPNPARMIANTLRAVVAVLPHLVDGSTSGPAARAARTGLNDLLMALPDVYATGREAATARRRTEAAGWWPALAVTEQIAHRTLSVCWQVDAGDPPDGPVLSGEQARRAGADLDRVAAELSRSAVPAVRDGPGPGDVADDGYGFLDAEIEALREALPGTGGRPPG